MPDKEKIEIVNLIGDGRPQYRLGDAVLKRDASYGLMAFNLVATAKHYFDGTILYEYASKIDRSSNDPQWDVLKKAVARKTRELELEPPKEDELVVHLRLGNQKGFNQSPETFVDYIVGLINGIGAPISQVTIVTAIHYGKSYLVKHENEERVSKDSINNRETVRKIIDLLKEMKIAAVLYSHEDIDKDFCFLSSSKYLVLGKGHFSLCAAMVSDSVIFVPPWARRGAEVDIDELLNQ